MKTCIVTSRSGVVEMDPDGSINLISISSSTRDYWNIVPIDGWGSFYGVMFDDVTESGDIPDTPAHAGWIDEVNPVIPFDQIQARALYEQIEFIQRSDSANVVVHCDAGMSRSAAVGRFLGDFYHYDVVYRKAGSDRFANIHVYNLLRRVWWERNFHQ